MFFLTYIIFGLIPVVGAALTIEYALKSPTEKAQKYIVTDTGESVEKISTFGAFLWISAGLILVAAVVEFINFLIYWEL